MTWDEWIRQRDEYWSFRAHWAGWFMYQSGPGVFSAYPRWLPVVSHARWLDAPDLRSLHELIIAFEAPYRARPSP